MRLPGRGSLGTTVLQQKCNVLKVREVKINLIVSTEDVIYNLVLIKYQIDRYFSPPARELFSILIGSLSLRNISHHAP